MMKKKMNLVQSLLMGFAAVMLVSCGDDKDDPKIEAPTAQFTYAVSGFDVTFTNASLNADSYSWAFGDGETSTLESPSHTYEMAGTYDVVLTAINEGGETVSTQTITIEEPVVVDPIFIDFETEVTLNAFGGSAAAIIANPDASGINVSANVVETTHGNETWAGFYFDLEEPLNVSGNTIFKVKVWAPATGFDFRLKIENIADGAEFHEYDQPITAANEWVELSFDLSNDINGAGAVSDKYARIVLFPGWNVADAGTFYVDDVQF